MDMLDTFSGLHVPTPFKSRRSIAALTMQLHDFSFDECDEVRPFVQALRSEYLAQLIRHGFVTFGMLKPLLHVNSRGLPDSDDAAAERLMQEIGLSRVALHFSAMFNIPEATAFYEPLGRQWAGQMSAYRSGRTVIEAVTDDLISGPVTCMLLDYPEGDAIERFRELIGYRVPSRADPDTLRARFAKDESLPNNLFHSSDSPDEALREINVVANVLMGYCL